MPPDSRRPRRSGLGQRLSIEPLESRLLLAVSPWSIDDQITVEGTHLTVRSTDGEDAFEFATDGEYRVTLNGVSRQFAVDSIDEITLIAGEDDTVVLHDTAGNDTIYADPAETRLVADGLTVVATGAGEVTVVADAGGIDEAYLNDSAGDDVFTGSPDVSTLSGDGFAFRVESVEYVHAYARSGGNDRAEISGSDADELFVGRETWSRLSGENYAIRVKFFGEVVAYAGGGSDHARIYDSAGDDYLSATPESATLSGRGFSNAAVGFDSVTAYASRGFDCAELVDSAGNDVLHGTPAQTTLYGSGYINRADGFDVVNAYARGGGYDIANLHDSAGDDRYIGTSEWGKLLGEDYFIRAKLFDSVHAYADSGGNDEAELRGTAGADSFESRSTHSWLRGAGYEHRVGGFDFVQAKASVGVDEALVYDSDGTDTLTVEERCVTLTEDPSGTVRRAQGFNVVTARLSEEGDQTVDVAEPGIALVVERPGAETTIYASAFLDSSDPAWGFQAAIDALPEEGGVVVLPEGTFTLRQGLVLRDGVTLRGAGEKTILERPDHVETRLTVTAATGATFVQVESTKGFTVGDDIAILAYGQSAVACHTIVKIESGKLYLDSPIAVVGTYAPVATASVVNYFPLVRTAWYYEAGSTADVVVEDLTLDGNLDELSEAWRLASPALIHLEKAVDGAVRNVTVRESNGGGIYLTGGHDNRIENVTIEKVRGHGILVNVEADAVISGATIRQAGYATRGDSGDGILVAGSSDVIVENSLVVGSRRHGLHPGGDLNRGGLWINNVSRNNGDNGFHFCFDNFDILVTGNVLEDNGRYGVGGLGLGGSFADMFNTVADNLIRGNAREGILVNGGSDNAIYRNTVVDNSLRRTGDFSGILLVNCTFVLVADNTIGTGGSRTTQKFGVSEYGTANDNLIVGNDASGNLEGGFYITGITTIVADNVGSVQFEI